MFENYLIVKQDCQREIPSRPMTCLRLTNHSGVIKGVESAVFGNAFVEIRWRQIVAGAN
jgi:hypothetical protein